MRIFRSRYFVSWPAPLLLCAFLLASCGTKGNPKPISSEFPPQINDLEAKVRPRVVEITWSIPTEPGLASYALRKSPIRWEDRDCASCPSVGADEVHMFDRFHPEPAVAGGGRMVWEDRNVNMNAAYRYQVSVLDRKGHVLSTSNLVAVKILPSPPPPLYLKADPERQGIALQWKAPHKSRDVTEPIEFLLERRPAGGAWEKASPVPITGDSFLDSGVRPNQVYDYRVSSLVVLDGVTILGESAMVRHVQAPDAIPPPPPETVWVLLTNAGLEVQWSESGGAVGGYHIYRRGANGEIVRLTGEPVKHPPFVDSNVQANALYFYAVSAVSSSPPFREGMVSKWIEIRNGAGRF